MFEQDRFLVSDEFQSHLKILKEYQERSGDQVRIEEALKQKVNDAYATAKLSEIEKLIKK